MHQREMPKEPNTKKQDRNELFPLFMEQESSGIIKGTDQVSPGEGRRASVVQRPACGDNKQDRW